MSDLAQDLQALSQQWRAVAYQARRSARDVDSPQAEGHLNGLSTSYDAAAEQIETLLAKASVTLKNQFSATRSKADPQSF